MAIHKKIAPAKSGSVKSAFAKNADHLERDRRRLEPAGSRHSQAQDRVRAILRRRQVAPAERHRMAHRADHEALRRSRRGDELTTRDSATAISRRPTPSIRRSSTSASAAAKRAPSNATTAPPPARSRRSGRARKNRRPSRPRRPGLPPSPFAATIPRSEPRQVEQIYKAFRQALEHSGQPVDKLSPRAFETFLRRKVEQLRKQKGGEDVEVVVSMEGGKAVLKARVKS